MTRYRPGTAADTRTCFDIFEVTVDDLGRRTGGGANSTSGDPNAFEIRRPMFEHLAATADEWWVAEDDATGRAVGYARSIVRDGVRELTEFFVLPDAQSAGVGRGLLARAFPDEGVRHRAIVATIDPRAIARYLRAGLDARVPMIGFEGAPRDERLATDLVREPMDPVDPPLEALAEVDRRLLGFRRDEDHRWLASQRPGVVYRRDASVGRLRLSPDAAVVGRTVCRARGGGPAGPHRRRRDAAAFAAGHATVTFDVALTARPALDHLLGRGFRVDPFVMLFFTDGPVDGLDRYVLTSPPFFA